jgi:predicted hotdog family 3-hydroxylacyl-ACP dehydratase
MTFANPRGWLYGFCDVQNAPELRDYRDAPPIAELLPHRPPMRLLDAWEFIDASSIVCRATLASQHSITVLDGLVDNGWCIELVAQAVAAYVGAQSWRMRAGPVMGFIVSCRDARFSRASVPVDVPLRISAKHVWGERTLGSFRGTVEVLGGVTRDEVSPTVGLDASAHVATVELGVFSGSLELGAFSEGVAQ